MKENLEGVDIVGFFVKLVKIVDQVKVILIFVEVIFEKNFLFIVVLIVG